MKRSILSEKSLVVLMFIMVVVVFSFAQADSKEIEKGFLDSNSSTTVPGQSESMEASLKIAETKQAISTVNLR